MPVGVVRFIPVVCYYNNLYYITEDRSEFSPSINIFGISDYTLSTLIKDAILVINIVTNSGMYIGQLIIVY